MPTPDASCKTWSDSAACVLRVQGVNIMQFCKEYNAQTQDKMGQIIPVEITVFEVRLQVVTWCRAKSQC